MRSSTRAPAPAQGRRAVGVLVSVVVLVAAATFPVGSAAAVDVAFGGTITDTAGLPVEGATVRAHQSCNELAAPVVVATTTSAVDGTYALTVPESCTFLEVEPPSGSGLATGWWVGHGDVPWPVMPRARYDLAVIAGVELPVPAPGVPIDVELGAPVQLDGVVTFDGAPLAGATVRVGAYTFGGDAAAGASVMDLAAEVVTAADGSWSLDGFGAGSWVLDVVPLAGSDAARTWSGDCAASSSYLGTYRPIGAAESRPYIFEHEACIESTWVWPGESATIDVDAVRGATVAGTVRGIDGTPVAGATVDVFDGTVSTFGSFWTREQSTTTAADGTYALRGISPRSWPRTGYYVQIVADGYRTEDRSAWSSWPASPIDFHMDLPSGAVVEQSPVLEPVCHGATSFTDVTLSMDWTSTAGATCGEVELLVEREISTGWPDGTFRPDTALSRAAWVTWLWRAAGSPPGPFPDPGFSDVPPTSPWRTAVAWAVANDVVRGYPDGTFRLAPPVTLHAAIVTAWRHAGEPGWPHPVDSFTDQVLGTAWRPPVGSSSRSPIRWSLEVGLLDPESIWWWMAPRIRAHPSDPMRRAQAASVLYDLDARTAG